jgi:hypothetical protein
MWAALPSILWIGVAIVAIVMLRRTLARLANVLLWRLRTGSALKIASLELGQLIRVDQEIQSGAAQAYTAVRPDSDNLRFKQRESYYLPNRNLQLVHRVAPSRDADYAYDVMIYLIPHRGTDATLACVSHVDYYAGRGWKNSIFTITNRARGFSIALSTHGPFVCTAEIHFTDGEVATVGRYIDGEMAGTMPVSNEE